jgi:hypothetical protein
VKKPTLSYPHVRVDSTGTGVVSHAGAVLLDRDGPGVWAGCGVIGRVGALAQAADGARPGEGRDGSGDRARVGR